MATLSTYKILPGGAVQIVTPEPLTGDGGQALNDNFKHIADSVIIPGGSIGELQYNDGDLLVGAGWKMAGTVGDERLLSPGTTDDGSTQFQVTGSGKFTGNVTAASFIGNLVGTASGSLPLTGGTITGNLTITGTGAGELSAKNVVTTDLSVSSTATIEVVQCLGSVQWSSGASSASLGYSDGQFGFDGDSFSFDCPVWFDSLSSIQADGTGELSVNGRIIVLSASEGLSISADAIVYGSLTMEGTPVNLDGSSSLVADGSGNVTMTLQQLNISTNGVIALSNPAGAGVVTIQNYGYVGNGSVAFSEAGGISLVEGGGKLVFDATNSGEISILTNTEYTSGGRLLLNGTNVLGNDGSGAGGGTWAMDGASLYFDSDSYVSGDGAGNVNLYSTAFNAAGTITAYDGNIVIGNITGGGDWEGEGFNFVVGSHQFSMVLSPDGSAYFGNTAAGTTWLEIGGSAVSCPYKLLVGGATDEGSGYSATFAGGAIAITGAAAGFQIDDRTLGSGHAWQHYATGGTFRIWTQTVGDRFTVDSSGDVTAVGNISGGGSLTVGQSATAPALANNSTISTDNTGVSRVAPTSSVSGIILQADSATRGGQHVVVINESAFTITFAGASTSYVADGSSSPIGGKTARSFVWNSGTSLWYRSA